MRPTVVLLCDQSAQWPQFENLLREIDASVHLRIFFRADDLFDLARQEELDLILIVHHLPLLNGLGIIRCLRSEQSMHAAPIMLIGADAGSGMLQLAFSLGASDCISFPIQPPEFVARCKNLLIQRTHYLAQHAQVSWLQERMAQIRRELHLSEVDTLFRLAGAAERRDAVTGAHLKRMAKYSALIARGLGLDEDESEAIELAAPMHDIGKLGIPDAIIGKSARLNADETAIMQTHAQIGYEILKDSPSRFMQAAAVIALHHHERFDGSGYPFGLRGEQIPLHARIVALADVFDALTSARPYKPAWEWTQALAFLDEYKKTYFDPALVDVFVRHSDAAHDILQRAAGAA